MDAAGAIKLPRLEASKESDTTSKETAFMAKREVRKGEVAGKESEERDSRGVFQVSMECCGALSGRSSGPLNSSAERMCRMGGGTARASVTAQQIGWCGI